MLEKVLSTGINLFVIVIISGFFGAAQAQRITTLRVGFYNPDGPAGNGFIGGVSIGGAVDESVTLGFGVDYYRRSFTSETIVAEEVDPSGNVISTVRRELESSANLIPIMLNVHVEIPDYHSRFSPYVSGGVGYEILFSSFTNFETREDDSSTFRGFGWQLMGGIAYRAGSESQILFEIFYNDSEPSRGKGENKEGFPVRDKVDVSGIGFRVGIRLGSFY